MSTFKGRERTRVGVVGGGAGLSAGEGFVYERVRPCGRGAVEGTGEEGEGEGEVLPLPRGLKDGKEGIKDVTDDHLLALEAPGPGALEGPGASPPPTGGVFGLVGICTGGVAGLGGGGGGGTGFNHFSKNLTTGMRADIVACEFEGELGKGKWITAFAWGGGRGGGSPPSPPSR